ncbi:hypothetical protein IPL68_00870 [Candidatus Saccharibacteria bacterium]|nr:MAG: hypothetical protein IPL68_00870 [Candidatus Saccharibacteria bacterium]
MSHESDITTTDQIGSDGVTNLAASVIAHELHTHPKERAGILHGVGAILEEEGVVVIDSEGALQSTKNGHKATDDVIRVFAEPKSCWRKSTMPESLIRA